MHLEDWDDLILVDDYLQMPLETPLLTDIGEDSTSSGSIDNPDGPKGLIVKWSLPSLETLTESGLKNIRWP